MNLVATSPPVSGRRAHALGQLRRVLPPELLALVLLIAAWQIVAKILSQAFLPTASSTIHRAYNLLSTSAMWHDIGTSMLSMVIGFAFSVVVGVLVGWLMALSKVVRYALTPYVNAMLVAPSLVFAPICFVIFGLSQTVIVFIVIISTMFYVIATSERALAGVDKSLIEMARCFGAKRWRVVCQVMIPAAMPLVFAGIEVGVARAIKGAVEGEMFIAVVGLGALLISYGGAFDSTGVLAVLSVVIVIALIATGLIRFTERRLTGWSDRPNA
jgi:ABC-type nitrate/sulfonate/bicarbonate transport system permease component